MGDIIPESQMFDNLYRSGLVTLTDLVDEGYHDAARYVMCSTPPINTSKSSTTDLPRKRPVEDVDKTCRKRRDITNGKDVEENIRAVGAPASGIIPFSSHDVEVAKLAALLLTCSISETF